MQKLFSYGTLQQANVQLATFGRLLDGMPDELPGYRLGEIAISDSRVVAASGKTHHPILIKTGCPDDRVAGMVYLLSDEELAAADAYEVDDYVRVAAVFASGETAWIYADARLQG
ncbi:MAG: gamma-glutamylcyclotransferase family protein [Neisseria sp.]|nr:gamma-glutamylcyclotransferase family protein [Neisseria sp.]